MKNGRRFIPACRWQQDIRLYGTDIRFIHWKREKNTPKKGEVPPSSDDVIHLIPSHGAPCSCRHHFQFYRSRRQESHPELQHPPLAAATFHIHLFWSPPAYSQSRTREWGQWAEARHKQVAGIGQMVPNNLKKTHL